MAGTSQDFVVRASDAAGAFDRQAWSVMVADPSSPNSAPIIDQRFTPRSTSRYGLPWSYAVHASDPDGEPLSFALIQAPPGMAIDNAGALNWTPTSGSPARVEVQIEVRDPRGGIAAQHFELDVSSIEHNREPEIVSRPILCAVVGSTYVYDAAAIDGDGDALRFSLQNAPPGMSIDADSGSIRWQPDALQLGQHAISLLVSDAFMGQSRQDFTLEVDCHNQPPAIVSVPPTLAFAERSYVYAVSSSDLEGDALHWTLDQAPVGMSIDAQRGIVRWQPADTQFGNHQVEIVVSDGPSAARQVFTLAVRDADEYLDPNDPSQGVRGNFPPVITSTPDFSTEVGGQYVYQLTYFDPDGDTVSLSLNAGAPAGVQLDGDGLLRWTPTASDVGNHRLSVLAVDARRARSTQSFTLNVSHNSPPTIHSTPPTQLTAGGVFRYTPRATDADGDPLTFDLLIAPPGMRIDAFGRIVWQAPLNDLTPQDVSFSVSDGRGQSTTQSWTIDLQPDQRPPDVSLSITSGNLEFTGDANIHLGSSYIIRVSATDNVALEHVQLRVAGELVALDERGAIALDATALGTLDVLASARDIGGWESSLHRQANGHRSRISQ